MSVRSKPKWEREAPAELERDGQDLPEGWVRVALRELTVPTRPRSDPQKSLDLRYVGMEQIESNSRRLLGTCSAWEMKSTAFHFQLGDVLYGRLRPYLNKVWRAEFEGLCSSEFIVLPPNGTFDPIYLACFLSSDEFVQFANHLNQGDRPRVSFDQIGVYDIPLPPLAEQRRIVAQLEALLGRVSRAKARLDRVPALLKRFRQSALAAACSGKLTADWREENPDTEAAAASLAACAASVDQKAIRHLVRRGTDGLPPVEPPEVPETWVTLTVRQLVETGAIVDFQDGNHGSLYPRSAEFGEVGVKFLTAQQVFDNRVLLDKTPLLNAEKAKLLRIGFAKPRDVLLTHNATVGRVAILPGYDGDVILGTSVTYYRTNATALLPEFLCYEMQGQYWQDQLRSVMEQTTRDQVSVTKQVEFRIMVPPLSEQQEIVRRVEKLFAFADQIEARLRQAQAHVDKLTQSILAKAFRGELVPTEAELARRERRDYEPASNLLERIRIGGTHEKKIRSKKHNQKNAEVGGSRE